MAKHMVAGSSKLAWAVEKILEAHRLTVIGVESRALLGLPNRTDLEFIPIHHHVTIANGEFQPLVIGRVSRGVVEVAHFIKHEFMQGLYEEIPDPRGTFSIYWPLLGFVPMRLEQRIQFGSGWAASEYDFQTGRIFYFDPRQMGGQVRFANMLARNLQAQGFADSREIAYSWAAVSADTCAEATLG